VERADRNCVIVTGPESTGKTSIAECLSQKLKGYYVPEYARDYISSLGRKYNYNDILHVARKQEDDFEINIKTDNRIVIFDTYLIGGIFA
jgi:nicotinamide riboside kinase